MRALATTNSTLDLYSWGNISFTDKQEALLSNGERAFYDTMKQFNLHLEDYRVNSYYPDNMFKYDFYFPSIDQYIEIAGLMDDPVYSYRIKIKQQRYGAIIVEYNNVSNKFLQQCVNTCRLIKDRIDANK